MEKTIKVGERYIKMRSSALIPRLYRFKFGRDMVQDMTAIQKAWKKVKDLSNDATDEEKKEAQLSVLDLTIFENVAYLFAKHADPSIPDSPEEWLDGFDMFSIYEVLPQILDLWQVSARTTSTPKKKRGKPHGRAMGHSLCSGAQN